ncbi:ABC transporter substrate-binding protein [Haloimpatiens lingqiaonensis]|uniref:ABC transporter substrate-binding protein n=1 Tax=Haloimpatiens lingqiaonensis TaxID=1380675 RepID=UPI0010FD8BA1|nr:ABC transporter substrate-binding protein [Haloimpatiens lingqiaonensis]
MKKKKILSLLLAVTCSLGLVACGNSTAKKDTKATAAKEEKIKDGGTMVFAFGTDPTKLNPFYQDNRVTFTVNNALFSPLFVMDSNEIRYYLADKVEESADKLTYKIKLKDNLKWHDGKKITVDDIIFSINTIWDEKQGIGDREGFLIGGKKFEMKKIDDLNLEIKLPQVYMPFKGAIGSLRPIPKHVYESEKDLAKSEKNNTPVGSGPYKFKEWKKGDHLTLERFNDYFGGKPHIEQIVYKVSADKNSSSIAFENGEINATYLSEKKFNTYSKDSKYKTYKFDESMPEYMAFNFENKLIAKKEVRQAISYAINKQDLLKSVFENVENAKPAYSVFPPSTLYYTDKVEHYDYNVEKAKELMKKANVSNGTLKFGYIAGSERDINQFNVIKENLKAIGIDVKPVPLEQQAFFSQLFGETPKTFDMTLNAYVCGTDPDSYSGLFVKGGAMNWTGYSNAELDDLWKKAAIETNEAKRKEMYETIQKKLAEDAAQYNIDYAISMIGVSGNIGGVEKAKTVPIYMFEDLSKLYFIEK